MPIMRDPYKAPNRNKHQISVQLTPDQMQAVDQIVDDSGDRLSRAAVVREAVDVYLRLKGYQVPASVRTVELIPA